jgi:hypothetical protein
MTDEPRIGWHQSVERNRLDAALLVVLDGLRLLALAADATERVNVDVIEEFKTNIRYAEGYLVDAQVSLRGGAAL